MHDRIVSEYPPQLRARQGGENRNLVRDSGPKSCPFRLTPIGGLKHQAYRVGSHPFARLFEPRDGLTRAPGKTKQVTNPPDQGCFQHINARKIGGNLNRTTGGAGDGPDQLSAFRANWYPVFGRPIGVRPVGAFYHIPGGTQPYSPARQFTGEIGNQRAVRTDDEPEHSLLRQTLPRDDATAHRAGFWLFPVRVNPIRVSHRVVESGAGVNRGLSPVP